MFVEEGKKKRENFEILWKVKVEGAPNLLLLCILRVYSVALDAMLNTVLFIVLMRHHNKTSGTTAQFSL